MSEQVWDYINTALSTASGPEKIQHLTAAKEWVIHRKQEIPPNELMDLVAELCSPALLMDSFPGVRHFVLQFIEELCRTQGATPQLLLKPMEALALMLEDTNQPDQIARWALTTAAKIWKSALGLLATQTKNADASKALKSLLWRIKSAGVEAVEKRKDKSSRINAVKFMEVMCMSMLNEPATSSSAARKKREAQTPSANVPTAPQFESLKDLPRFAHPALPKSNEIHQEGMALLDVLAKTMRSPETPVQVRTACSNSLVLVARMRPDAREPVVDALSEMTTAGVSRDIAFAQALKTNGIMLLKSVVPDEKSLDSPMLPKLIQVLRSLKAEEHIARHLDPLRKRKSAQDAEAEEIKRRLKDYPPQQNKFPTEGLHLLPIETLARLLVDNAGNVPEKPPPGHHFRPPKDQQILLGPTGLPPRLERLMALIRAVETGRGGILPRPLQEVKAPELSQDQALKQRESAFERICRAALDSNQLGLGTRGFGWSEKAHETYGMVAARLACDYDVSSPVASLDESMEAEHQNERRPGELQEQLIQDLLVNIGGSGGATSEEEVAAIAALNLEFVAERCNTPDDNNVNRTGRYETFLNKLIGGLVADVGRNHKRLGRILSDAPSVPDSALQLVLVHCENMEVYKQLFSMAREVALARPTSRAALMNVLLMYATSPDPIVPSTAPKSAPGTMMALKDRRLDAVRLIANRLYKGLGNTWTVTMQRFAFDVLKSVSFSLKEVAPEAQKVRSEAKRFISTLPEADANDVDPTQFRPMTAEEEKTEILSRIHLFIGLCATDVSLLHQLLSGYAEIRKRVSRESALALQQHQGVSDMELRIKQRVSRIFDQIHTEADLLFTKLSTEVNNSGKLVGMLQNFAPGAEDLVLRACMIFAKKDPDGAVLAVSSLRSNGAEETMVDVDPRFLIPIIGSLPQEEALQGLSRLALYAGKLHAGEPIKIKEEIKRALDAIVNGSSGRSIEVSKLLVTLANMSTDDVQTLMLSTDAFMEMKNLVTDRVMRKVFQELVEQEEYPVVLLRILITTYKLLPGLKLDALEVLQRLVEREIWHNESLWKGFVILAGKLLPESFEMILRLPDDIFKSFVTEMEKTNRNFRDLLRNAAQLNQTVVDAVATTEGNEASTEGEKDERRSQGLSAFAKEYLGLSSQEPRRAA